MKTKHINDAIKKWETILDRDAKREIVYSKNVLKEMLTDFKKATKLLK